MTISELVRSEWRRLALQAGFIMLAVVSSVAAVSWVLEKSLVKQALSLEAEAFFAAYRQDVSFPLPHTRNLVGYLDSPQRQSLPPAVLRNLKAGLHPQVSMPGKTQPVPVYIEERDGERLFLVFEGANIDRLVGIYGLVPLSLLLVILYTASWLAYRISWGAVSPILRIAQNVRESDPEGKQLAFPTGLSGEAKELALALQEYSKRIDAFVDRERQFTADVSHELRTPMTIIDGAAQFLLREKALSDKGRDRVRMVRRACRDVNELIDAFFLLAREQASSGDAPTVSVVEVVEREMVKLSTLIESKAISLDLQVVADFTVTTPPKALEIILGNLLRNAGKYTEQGCIEVHVLGDHVLLRDSGPGIDPALIPHLFERHVRGRGLQQAGEGIGLAIVKRLCDQFHWQISLNNRYTESHADHPAGVDVILRPSVPARQ